MQYYKLEREVKKTVLTGRSPLRRQKSALDCSAIEEDDEEDHKLSMNINIHI
jgi:hypothetical protein